MIELYNLEEMKPYYNEEFNGYIFTDDVYFDFDLDINSDIKAHNIIARNINACDINAWDIDAKNINAYDINTNCIKANNITAYDIDAFKIIADNINFYAICCAYITLKCKSIKGRRENNKIICLDNNIEINGGE